MDLLFIFEINQKFIFKFGTKLKRNKYNKVFSKGDK